MLMSELKELCIEAMRESIEKGNGKWKKVINDFVEKHPEPKEVAIKRQVYEKNKCDNFSNVGYNNFKKKLNVLKQINGKCDLSSVADVFAVVEEKNKRVTDIYINPNKFKELKKDKYVKKYLSKWHSRPMLWGAFVTSSSDIPEKEILVVSDDFGSKEEKHDKAAILKI
jgi:hypothetical protein